jgi:hypothetical protein
LLAKASQVGEELVRLHQGLENVERLFEAKQPWFQSSERVSLGFSEDLLPVKTLRLTELRHALADSFCSQRRLSHLEKMLNEEVLQPLGGLAVVATREPRVLPQVFENMLHRVARAVDHWLESRDAASILLERYGSVEVAANELLHSWKSTTFGSPERACRRLIVGTPASPSGRSLRECLAKSASAPSHFDFVTIPDDVVLCLELDNVSIAAVAADLVSGQSWLADLAPKLVSRKDVSWPWLAGMQVLRKPAGGGEDL